MHWARALSRAACVVLLATAGCFGDDDANDPDLPNDDDASTQEQDGDGGGDGDGDPGDGDGDPGDDDGDPGDGDGDGDPGDGDGDGDGDVNNGIPGDCPELGPTTPPETLRCAGLYSDVESKKLAAGVRMFKPAIELWSDGAEKTRWISLPEGETIDVSDRDAWVFPIGTRLFKEFKWNGKRAETRLYWKRTPTFWSRATYHWNEDETEATRHGGGEVQVGGESYLIPSGTECDQCHEGRPDNVLGFETILLGLEGAEGITLADAVADGMLSDDDYSTDITLGDDGTGEAAAAMGWMHVNCGISCHNGNSSSEAYRTGLRLALQADEAEGGGLSGADALATTIGVDATTPRWDDWQRIVPGNPDESLVFWLMSMRNPANRKDQMPPIASRVVDDEGVRLVENWIMALENP